MLLIILSNELLQRGILPLPQVWRLSSLFQYHHHCRYAQRPVCRVWKTRMKQEQMIHIAPLSEEGRSVLGMLICHSTKKSYTNNIVSCVAYISHRHDNACSW